MAGGIGGNLKPFWNDVAQLMQKGVCFEQAKVTAMKIFLADSGTLREAYCEEPTIKYRPYILESFYYADKETERLLPYFGDFMLDSGAFTFMQNAHEAKLDWDEYIERYADFIRRNKIEKFFELDIDSVVGYDRVLELRAKLERLAGRPSIPVWHYNRGREGFLRMCDEYDYVSIGSNSQNDKHLHWFISTAHKRGAKIHGLGYTKLAMLPKMHFDSVDSTGWTAGNRFGFVFWFDGKTLQKRSCPHGMRLKSARDVAVNNYTEWIKFQKYAEARL